MGHASKMVAAALLAAATTGLSLDAAAADPLYGRLLAAQCAQCHGTNGSGGFERLVGRSASSLYGDLIDMKYRPPEGIMDMQARGYTDAQLRLIADYFASLSGTTVSAE